MPIRGVDLLIGPAATGIARGPAPKVGSSMRFQSFTPNPWARDLVVRSTPMTESEAAAAFLRAALRLSLESPAVPREPIGE